MEDITQKLYHNLQRQIGLHRELIDLVRAEHEFLLTADIEKIKETTSAKESTISEIHQLERARLSLMGGFAVIYKTPVSELTLPLLIQFTYGKDKEASERLQKSYNTLKILVQRIQVQNSKNQTLVENSLSHIQSMKNNVLGEAAGPSQTYSPKGEKVGKASQARLLSKEV